MTEAKGVMPTILNADTAPILYFEGVAALGHVNGICSLVLTVGRPVPVSDGNVPTIFTTVGILKGNREALLNLKDTVEKALLLAEQPAGQPN